MKIQIGHKVLNLEELYLVSYLGAPQAELVIDSQLYAELSTAAAKDKETKPFEALKDGEVELKFNYNQIRAILLAKLV